MTKYLEMFGKYGDRKFVVMDDQDYDFYSQWTWHVDKRGYVVRNVWIVENGKRKCITIQLHVEINQTPKGVDTDHKNRDRLDCRRDNLRKSTDKESARNQGKKSKKNKYKGVYTQPWSGRFVVMCSIHKKNECWGTYDTEEFAAHVYDYVTNKYHGEFAYLNFPHEVPSEQYNPDNCRVIRYKNR
jgi:hypothetical protein